MSNHSTDQPREPKTRRFAHRTKPTDDKAALDDADEPDAPLVEPLVDDFESLGYSEHQYDQFRQGPEEETVGPEAITEREIEESFPHAAATGINRRIEELGTIQWDKMQIAMSQGRTKEEFKASSKFADHPDFDRTWDELYE